MNIKRIVRHLTMTPWQVRRCFTASTLSVIEVAIKDGERLHAGQVRFAVEGALHTSALLRGHTAGAQALDVFSLLRVWDTEYNNGVLIYLLLADHDVEIVADRGIHAKVDAQEWQRICRIMETSFSRGHYEEGAVEGILAVTHLLAEHFPAEGYRVNELSDRPVVL
ncbi:TPM domain-containing protein [Pseudogulbenkiania ferrooxidans]|uniref:TPM domain-containing protein n=1 Tax=Pseudogulbenkiania ferrooxidans 2002 TaxID=279714 RepID=B9Z3U9_9NEIS|nr:TPM domain-containing protein [Pseudogulbenkiania ferrooxidans]EEG08526.1 protein of unknown function DUF477 [Pseudogulbenkiania ferrooxidans 2002]